MIEIRRMTPEEWETVRSLRLAALQDAPDWFWSTYEREVDLPEERWRRTVQDGAWFVAFHLDNPVGIAAAMPSDRLEVGERQVISMWVEPGARRLGVGVGLIDAIKVWAREQGLTALQLEVTEGNVSAARLYEGGGFRATGRTTPHPRQPSLVEREMRLQL